MTESKPTIEVNVLIVFYSRYGATEKLALAAGVGAIQARANIRLRRLVDLADPAVIDADANWKENLARMNLDYVVPREADPAWADAIIFASPADASVEISSYLRSLQNLAGVERSFARKVSAPFVSGSNDVALKSFHLESKAAGFAVIPGVVLSAEDARLFGRRAAEMARTLKSS